MLPLEDFICIPTSMDGTSEKVEVMPVESRRLRKCRLALLDFVRLQLQKLVHFLCEEELQILNRALMDMEQWPSEEQAFYVDNAVKIVQYIEEWKATRDFDENRLLKWIFIVNGMNKNNPNCPYALEAHGLDYLEKSFQGRLQTFAYLFYLKHLIFLSKLSDEEKEGESIGGVMWYKVYQDLKDNTFISKSDFFNRVLSNVYDYLEKYSNASYMQVKPISLRR